MCSDRLYADVHYVLSVMCPRMNDSYDRFDPMFKYHFTLFILTTKLHFVSITSGVGLFHIDAVPSSFRRRFVFFFFFFRTISIFCSFIFIHIYIFILPSFYGTLFSMFRFDRYSTILLIILSQRARALSSTCPSLMVCFHRKKN